MDHELLREKNDIVNWLEQYKITNYHLMRNKEYGYIVNVSGSVNLSGKKLNSIAVKFNKIEGSFQCQNNQLSGLEGAPNIVKEDFNCSNNQLISLNGSPKEVGKTFSCVFNKLIDLKGLKLEKVRDFYCNHNQIRHIRSVDLPPIIRYIFLDNNPELEELQKINSPKKLKEILVIKEENKKLKEIVENTANCVKILKL